MRELRAQVQQLQIGYTRPGFDFDPQLRGCLQPKVRTHAALGIAIGLPLDLIALAVVSTVLTGLAGLGNTN